MSKEKNTTAITEDMTQQIAQWKKEHGDVYKIKVTDPADEKKVYACFVKKPSKNHIAAAAPFMQSDPVKAGDILRSNCYLAGDPEVLAMDECLIAVNLQIIGLFKLAVTELEKL